jgi:hypothetical protein
MIDDVGGKLVLEKGYEDISASTSFWVAVSAKWDPTKKPAWTLVKDITGDNSAGYGHVSLVAKPISHGN